MDHAESELPSGAAPERLYREVARALTQVGLASKATDIVSKIAAK